MRPHAEARKRIVVAALGMPDHVIPFLDLARALRGRGHDVAVATGRAYAPAVASRGLVFHPLSPNVSPADAETVAIFRSRGGRALAAREVFAHTLRASYDELCRAASGADLLLSGEMTFAAPLVAEVTGIRWASGAVTSSSFHSSFDPPSVANTRPVRAVTWFSQKAGHALVRRRRPRDQGLFQQFAGLREQLHLTAAVRPLFEGVHSPDLVLTLFAEILGPPQRDWPPQVVQSGYPFHESGGRPDDIPAGIREFIDAGPPPFVFSLGACRPEEAETFVAAGAEAARQLGRRALFLTDGHSARQRPEGRPAVYACETLWRVFQHGAVVVHRGGAVETAHGLRAARPTLVVPRGDEERDNAARLTRLGVAITLDGRNFCADAVVDTLRRLKGDAGFERAASDARTRVEAEGGAGAACDAVEELLFHESGGLAPATPGTGRAHPAREARELEDGLAILREMTSDPRMPPTRLRYKYLFLMCMLFYVVLFTGIWWFYVTPLLASPRAQQIGTSASRPGAATAHHSGPTDLQTSVIFLVSAVIIAAPMLGYVTKKSFDWLSDERIEEPGYERRLIFDLRYAGKLRGRAGSVERLKVLAAHVKRETDKTADRMNAIAHAASSVGIFLGGALLLAERGDTGSAAMIASMGVVVAAFARVSATFRLAMLRHWQAVIEQAQNLAGS